MQFCEGERWGTSKETGGGNSQEKGGADADGRGMILNLAGWSAAARVHKGFTHTYA